MAGIKEEEMKTMGEIKQMWQECLDESKKREKRWQEHLDGSKKRWQKYFDECKKREEEEAIKKIKERRASIIIQTQWHAYTGYKKLIKATIVFQCAWRMKIAKRRLEIRKTALEERKKIILEEERRKLAAKQKLLELEENMARRQIRDSRMTWTRTKSLDKNLKGSNHQVTKEDYQLPRQRQHRGRWNYPTPDISERHHPKSSWRGNTIMQGRAQKKLGLIHPRDKKENQGDDLLGSYEKLPPRATNCPIACPHKELPSNRSNKGGGIVMDIKYGGVLCFTTYGMCTKIINTYWEWGPMHALSSALNQVTKQLICEPILANYFCEYNLVILAGTSCMPPRQKIQWRVRNKSKVFTKGARLQKKMRQRRYRPMKLSLTSKDDNGKRKGGATVLEHQTTKERDRYKTMEDTRHLALKERGRNIRTSIKDEGKQKDVYQASIKDEGKQKDADQASIKDKGKQKEMYQVEDLLGHMGIRHKWPNLEEKILHQRRYVGRHRKWFDPCFEGEAKFQEGVK